MITLESVSAENPLCIVDIGASGGLTPPFHLLSHRKAILVEPDDRAVGTLQESGSDARQDWVISKPLADRPRVIDFHFAADQECSSCFEPNMDILRRYPNPERFRIVRSAQMTASTLDDEVEKIGCDIDFLKLDVQGFEFEILQGAKKALTRAVGVIVEVEFEELYLGQKLFPDVHGLLVQSGLRLFDLQRSFWKRNATGEFPSEKGRLLFANALYLKEPEDVVLQFCGDDEKLVRAALVYHAFHYGDLLRTLHDLVPVEHKMKLDVLASSLGRSKPSGTNRIPASFDLLRRKTHGLLARIERVCGTLRKSIYGHTDHFGSCDSTLGN